MADEKPDDEPVEVPAEDATPPEKPAETPPPPPAETPSDDSAKIAEAIECMAKLGLHVGKATDADNFLDQLIAACKTKEAHEVENADVGEEDLEDEDEIPDENQPGSQPANPPSPILMSQVSALQTRERDLVSRLAGDRRGKLKKRIERLSKKVGVDVTNRLLSELRTTHDDQLVAPISLSSAEASQALPLILTIESLEKAMKQGKFAGNAGISMSGVEVVNAPSGPAGGGETQQLDVYVVDRLSQGMYSRQQQKRAAAKK